MRFLLIGDTAESGIPPEADLRLFQNRYKSILCQEDTYLLELVRYIHLNPIRAHMVENIEALDHYSYSGHSAVMGKVDRQWQDVRGVLEHFGGRIGTARRRYKVFVEKGVLKGTKPGQGPQSFLLLGGTRAWDEHVGAFEKTGTVSGRRKSVGQAW